MDNVALNICAVHYRDDPDVGSLLPQVVTPPLVPVEMGAPFFQMTRRRGQRASPHSLVAIHTQSLSDVDGGCTILTMNLTAAIRDSEQP